MDISRRRTVARTGHMDCEGCENKDTCDKQSGGEEDQTEE